MKAASSAGTWATQSSWQVVLTNIFSYMNNVQQQINEGIRLVTDIKCRSLKAIPKKN
jgi:hypothetical protein